jgi:uncharacterized protein YdcH (DUF465 family)
MRFHDIEEDRTSMRELVLQLTEQLKGNIESLKAQTSENKRLFNEVNDLNKSIKKLSAEYAEKCSQCERLISELGSSGTELTSLRESLRVIELDNKDLVANENRLRSKLLEYEKVNECSREALQGEDPARNDSQLEVDIAAVVEDAPADVLPSPIRYSAKEAILPSVINEEDEDDESALEAVRYGALV